VEQNIVSVERILHQTEVKPEAPLELPERKPVEGWPSSGEIEFKFAHHLFCLNDTDVYDRNYSTKYRPELDLVLKDISIKIVNLVPFTNFSSADYRYF
jgi:ATP-binding cassette subfamily C (CFTR/MRP) protein 1